MQSLTNKRVLLGVTGGIAAYKSADLIRRLQDAGADVRVAMTDGAQAFITPLTMQALSGKPVHTSLLDTEAEAAMGHIELARWADVILVAPATADFIAKLAAGEGGDLLTTLCLAARSEVAVAPAMNQAMWASEATQANMATIAGRGVHIFGPASGGQACGDVGLGRMLEPTDICRAASELFSTGLFAGKRVVITAGPTREPIDPVRYISNHSSGKMGYALAEALAEAGAKVSLVSGPTNLATPDRVERINVETALEMADAVETEIAGADVFVGSAAVADYRPVLIADQKLKKANGGISAIELTENPDIIAGVAALENKPFTVGFAAETQNVKSYALKKLRNKKLDMIIANDVSASGIGFNSDNNAVLIFDAFSADEEVKRYETMSKTQLARHLVSEIAQALAKNKN